MKARTKNKLKKFYKRTMKTIKRPDLVLLPGQLAFFLVLAIIPTMTLISYGASVLNLSLDFLHRFLQMAFSKEIADLILSTSPLGGGLSLTIVIIISYYLASNGADSVIVVSNAIYGIKNSSWIKRRLKAFVMSIMLVAMIVFMLIVPIFGTKIVELIQSVNMNPLITETIVNVFNYLESPIMWIILFLIIKALYVVAPDKKLKGRNTNYGAIFTTFCWIVSTGLYSFYINNIANYATFYGGLTSVCILMIWFYFIAFFFVFGMSLNHEIEVEGLEKIAVMFDKK